MEAKAIKLLAMKDVEGYGNQKVIDTISNYGSLDGAFDSFLNKSLIESKDLAEYEKIQKICKDNQIHLISYFDSIYPSNLKKIGSPPLVLFAKGNLELLKMPSISIVGTRISSEKSLNWTYAGSKELANLGYVIISGGALGIDTAAHRGALDSTGNTICILGSGIRNIYPKENSQLVEDISKKGLVISEYFPDSHVSRFSLLERNRITSGLGDKILVVSSKSNGGAMSQYKIALRQKKEIFCPHPDLKLEPTEGIEQIIKDNPKIKIISKIQDMLKLSEDQICQKVIESVV